SVPCEAQDGEANGVARCRLGTAKGSSGRPLWARACMNTSKRATTRVAPIGANLPDWVLVCPFSCWFHEMAAKILRGSEQCARVRRWGDRFNECPDDQA